MKLIYLTVDGRARMETVPVTQRLIRHWDGDHPLTNDGVWHDAKRVRQPILLIIQGVLGSYGSSMTNADTKHVIFEIDAAERAMKNMPISRQWQRAFAGFIEWLTKYGLWLFLILIAAWALIPTFIGG